jgi:hypothetical protein
MNIPDAVFVSAATGSIRTRSERGLIFKAIMFKLIIYYFEFETQF